MTDRWVTTVYLKPLCSLSDSPVPTPSLRPPSRLLASLSRSQTVSSTQASARSTSLMPSYTMVWLNTGSTVLRSTRVFCRLFLLVSGSTKLGNKGRKSHLLHWRDTLKTEEWRLICMIGVLKGIQLFYPLWFMIYWDFIQLLSGHFTKAGTKSCRTVQLFCDGNKRASLSKQLRMIIHPSWPALSRYIV